MNGLERREFIGAAVAAGTVASVAKAENSGPDVWVLHGKNKTALMNRALEIISANGGFGANAKQLTLKVNAAWDRKPEEGANTHPELVAAFLAGVRKSGIRNVLMPEHPCHRAAKCFATSGIADVAKAGKAEMIDLKTEQESYRAVEISGGKTLKSAEVASEFLDTDVLVNMPVAKHHGGAILSCAMKNWMGAIKDRRAWHAAGLHQCIADFSTFIRPDWTIIDATRCMMDSGPQGPAKMLKTPDLLVVSKDQVAADAWVSTLFHDSIAAIKYLEIARDMGIGETDVNKMNVQRVEVA